jgi:hypothetical protein
VIRPNGAKRKLDMSDIYSSAACGNLPGAIARDKAAKAVGVNNPQLLTAAPVGTRWCVKAITQSGDAALVGAFDDRLSALGAAVLVAEQVGAQVLP